MHHLWEKPQLQHILRSHHRPCHPEHLLQDPQWHPRMVFLDTHPAMGWRIQMCRHPMRRWSTHHRHRQEWVRLQWGQWEIPQLGLLLLRLPEMSRSLQWRSRRTAPCGRSRLLDICRVTTWLKVTYRSSGWGVYITPAAITGVCQISSYPSKLGVRHPEVSGLVIFWDSSGQVREAIEENRSLWSRGSPFAQSAEPSSWVQKKGVQIFWASLQVSWTSLQLIWTSLQVLWT